MRSAKSTMLKRISLLAMVTIGYSALVMAQNTNSPYSRYGIGDLLPNQNILNRGMGGVAAGYSDFQSINFLNPASYGSLQSVTYDFGAEVDNLTIRQLNPVKKFSNSSPVISYVNLGIPIKIKGKPSHWGLVVGLRPMSRIGYKIQRLEKLTGGTLNDSVVTFFEGNGGAQQAFVGTGYRIGNLQFGVNAGYVFGSKDYSTRRLFLQDTFPHYKSNHQTASNFNGFLLNAGVQYNAKLNKTSYLRMGVSGSWKQQLNATRDITRETFDYDANSASYQIDSVYALKDQKGKVTMPSTYTAGILFDKVGKYQFGVDYTTTRWSDYRYFGETEPVQNSWDLRVGGMLIPSSGKSYWSNVAYRTGFSYGKDYVNLGSELPRWGISFGAGLPMRRVYGTNQFTIINTSFEFGQRGNANSTIRENFFRVSLGLSMSDIWFIKRQYN